ncbi:MAG: hypothetical protein RXQ95_00900 [Vulcanisaeta sp.]
MEVIKEVGGDDIKVMFVKDDQNAVLEALYVKGFSEDRYRKLRRYIKERLGEEFTGILNMDTGKALSKVLLISADLVNNLLVSDVIELEIDKTGRWIEDGILSELVNKVVSEVKEAKKAKRRKARRKRKRKAKAAKSGTRAKRARGRRKSKKRSE